MPKFFFNVMTANGRIDDPEGTELDNLAQARTEAIADARELMSTAMSEGRTIFGRSIDICDEAGTVLMTLPFSEAVQSSD